MTEQLDPCRPVYAVREGPLDLWEIVGAEVAQRFRSADFEVRRNAAGVFRDENIDLVNRQWTADLERERYASTG